MYLKIAQIVAEQSKDPNTQVGAVLVKDDSIVITGRNGYCRGAADYSLPRTSPEKYEYFIHAELNAVLNAVRLGRSISGCIVYLTHSPCPNCVRHLWQAGISEYVVSSLHKTSEGYKDMLDLDVVVKQEPNYFTIKVNVR